jgi:hypothetical protein
MQKSILVICLILIYLTAACQRNGEDCIYLIPESFQGNILIVFDQPNGVDTMYEGKNRVYKLDTSGFLRTKFKSNYGIQKNEFFYQDSLGNRKIIKYAATLSQSSGIDEIAFNKETGKDFDKVKAIDRDFEMITIATPANIDSIGNLRSSFMWSKLPQNK